MIPLLLATLIGGQAGKPLVVGDLLPDVQVQAVDGTWQSLVDHLNHKPTVVLRLIRSNNGAIIELDKASAELARIGYSSLIVSDVRLQRVSKPVESFILTKSQLRKFFPPDVHERPVLYIVDSSAEVREVDPLGVKPMTAAQIIKAAKDAL